MEKPYIINTHSHTNMLRDTNIDEAILNIDLPEVKKVDNFDEGVQKMLNGDALIIIEGFIFCFTFGLPVPGSLQNTDIWILKEKIRPIQFAALIVCTCGLILICTKA